MYYNEILTKVEDTKTDFKIATVGLIKLFNV